MASNRWPYKDHDEELDFDIDWAGTVDEPGRTYGDPLRTSIWFISKNDDGVLIIRSDSLSANSTKVWLAGGTIGRTYRLTNRITTLAGRTMDLTGVLTVREK